MPTILPAYRKKVWTHQVWERSGAYITNCNGFLSCPHWHCRHNVDWSFSQPLTSHITLFPFYSWLPSCNEFFCKISALHITSEHYLLEFLSAFSFSFLSQTPSSHFVLNLSILWTIKYPQSSLWLTWTVLTVSILWDTTPPEQSSNRFMVRELN